MRKWLLCAVAVLLCAPFASAQFTAVSANVKDSNGNVYAGCRGDAVFVPNPSGTTQPLLGGSVFPTDVVISQCDSFGGFTLNLADVAQVVPSGGTWKFNLRASDGTHGFSYTAPICPTAGCVTGSSLNITSAIQTVAPLLSPLSNPLLNCTPTSVVFSATETFDASSFCLFQLTLTGNVTSSTIINPVTGRVIQFEITQNGSGGNTFAWPASVLNPPTICSAANCTSRIELRYNGTNWVNPSDTVSNLTVTGPMTATAAQNSINASLNGIFEVGGNQNATLAAALGACPVTATGCHVGINAAAGPLTISTNAVYGTGGSGAAGSTLELEGVNPSTVNGNTGGTQINFAPASCIGMLTMTNQTRLVLKNLNIVVTPPSCTSAALTNITWSSNTATANCSSTCTQFAVNQIVNITGNSVLNPAGPPSITNYPVFVTAVGTNTFSFTYPNSATGTGGTATPLYDVTSLLGTQGATLINTQITGHIGGVGLHLVGIGGGSPSSAEYLTCINSFIQFGGVGIALDSNAALTNSANANNFNGCVNGGNNIIDTMTTGASEMTIVGGEFSDGGKNKPVLFRNGNGADPCRGQYIFGLTMESNNTSPSGQIGIENHCQGMFVVWEGGLGGATNPTPILDSTGPAGVCHWSFQTSGLALGVHSEFTCDPIKWDSAGDLAAKGTSLAGCAGGGPNLCGFSNITFGGSTMFGFSASLVTVGNPVTAFYPTNNGGTSSGRSGNGWASVFGTEGSCPSANATQDIFCFNSTNHDIESSLNGGSFLHVPQTIASGTSTMTSGAITAATCQAAITTTATGTATTDAIEWAYATAPTLTTDALLHISPYVTSGNVNFTRCNPTAGSITGTAIVINWRVVR